MKNVFFALSAVTIFLSSCKKNHTCACEVTTRTGIPSYHTEYFLGIWSVTVNDTIWSEKDTAVNFYQYETLTSSRAVKKCNKEHSGKTLEYATGQQTTLKETVFIKRCTLK